MFRLLIAVLCSLVLLFFSSSVSLAAPKKKSPTVSGSLAKNKLSVSANFSNLTKVKSFTYSLTYDASNGQQGAGGTVKVSKKNKKLSRKILLGTCSKNVCTYHRNVKNLKLSVDFKLKSGGMVSYEKKIR
ncbi:MAG: hypothetical protein AAB599_00725 [Patescibacteria group bacterium]